MTMNDPVSESIDQSIDKLIN